MKIAKTTPPKRINNIIDIHFNIDETFKNLVDVNL